MNNTRVSLPSSSAAVLQPRLVCPARVLVGQTWAAGPMPAPRTNPAED